MDACTDTLKVRRYSVTAIQLRTNVSFYESRIFASGVEMPFAVRNCAMHKLNAKKHKNSIYSKICIVSNRYAKQP